MKVSCFSLQANYKSLDFLFGSFGMHTLRTLPLATQMLSSEKLKSPGRCMCGHCGQQPGWAPSRWPRSANSSVRKPLWNEWAQTALQVSAAAAAAAKSLQSCPTLWPHRRQPMRLPHPWYSPGKNTGVGCHFLLPRYLQLQSNSEHKPMKVPTWEVPSWISLNQRSMRL